MILLDTNLLGRITDSADPQSAVARKAIHDLLSKRERLIVVPQNLYEFWAVATRKEGPPPSGQNGLGMRVEQASQWLLFFQRRFTLLPDHQNDAYPSGRMLQPGCVFRNLDYVLIVEMVGSPKSGTVNQQRRASRQNE